MKRNELNWRTHGKYFTQYMEFCEQVRLGKTIEIHAPGYVVMNRKRYEQLLKRACPPQIEIDEANK